MAPDDASGSTFEQLIERTRDGQPLTQAQIEWLVSGFVAGSCPDYQMAAWLMAACLKGLTPEETVWLTQAMVHTGRSITFPAELGPIVDKHSTGGVGDKTTLVLVPLVASCGVRIAKISGRGLGHTGGTLDKLESIPGFCVAMDTDDFARQVSEVGCAVMAQTDEIDPADRMLYALRDVTGTVPSVPLIVSSIISKKVAGGASAILLDVKAGSGAFMKDAHEAAALAAELERVGAALGRSVRSIVTDMDQPLGHAVGNALEVREAIATLRGDGPADLLELCLELGAHMLMLGGRATRMDGARELLKDSVRSGRATAAFRRWVVAQGGDDRVAVDPQLLPLAPVTRTVGAPSAGWVAGFDTEAVGRAAMLMGAGRARLGDHIDPAAGLVLHAKVGDRIERGAPLATMHASRKDLAEQGAVRFLAAVRMSETPVSRRPIVVDPRKGSGPA